MSNKINFKINFRSQNGTIERIPLRDFTKIKMVDGRPEAEIVLDSNGYVVLEETMLHSVIVSILEATHKGDESITGIEKLRRHTLAMKVFNAAPDGEEYTRDELDLIETLAAKSSNTLVLGRINEAINAKC